MEYTEKYVRMIAAYLMSLSDDISISEYDEVKKPINNILYQNFPNPFNPNTTIRFSLANAGNLDIDIFNIRGQRVRLLVSGFWSQGTHSVIWDGSDDNGRNLGSGIYFCRMTTDDWSSTKRLMILK